MTKAKSGNLIRYVEVYNPPGPGSGPPYGCFEWMLTPDEYPRVLAEAKPLTGRDVPSGYGPGRLIGLVDYRGGEAIFTPHVKPRRKRE